MTLLERYVFRQILTAFLAALAALTAVIWVTQIVREFDLVTAKGQAALVFLTFTALSLPALVTIIAPVALFAAVLYVLNKLNGDSELIVMNAAGQAPRRLWRPVGLMAGAVFGLVAAMTLVLMPESFRSLRDLVTKIRADFVGKIVKEGQFTTLESGIVFHYREKSGEALLGIFMQDRREANLSIAYLAERGAVTEIEGSTYLVLEKGSVQRQTAGSRDASLVAFDRYAVDLAQFSPAGGAVQYKPREWLTADLLRRQPEPGMPAALEGRFRAELHERFATPLYGLAFAAIAVAAMGQARTTRQGRGLALVAAVLTMALVRVGGFAISSAIARTPALIPLAYALPILAVIGSVLWLQAPEWRVWARGRARAAELAGAAPAFAR